jgi:hypothetical protein
VIEHTHGLQLVVEHKHGLHVVIEHTHTSWSNTSAPKSRFISDGCQMRYFARDLPSGVCAILGTPNLSDPTDDCARVRQGVMPLGLPGSKCRIRGRRFMQALDRRKVSRANGAAVVEELVLNNGVEVNDVLEVVAELTSWHRTMTCRCRRSGSRVGVLEVVRELVDECSRWAMVRWLAEPTGRCQTQWLSSMSLTSTLDPQPTKNAARDRRRSDGKPEQVQRIRSMT